MKKKTKFIIRALALIVCIILLPMNYTASAKEAYPSYNYDNATNALAAPEAVIFEKTVSGFESLPFGSISDLYYDAVGGCVYAVDKTNSRIIKLDNNGNFISVIDSFLNGELRDTFNSPSGIFVDENENLYIADTENGRIVELSKEGVLRRIIDSPESTVLSENFEFKPTRVALDSIDRIYVLATGFNQGVLCLDEDGEFLSCLGTPAVSFNLVDYLWKKISTDEQKKRMEKFIPTEYNNISIDSEDFIYATCSAYTLWDYINGKAEPLKKLNAKGNDILKEDNEFAPYGDRVIVKKGDVTGGSVMVDAIPLDYGMFATLDSNRGRVFVYNEQSELLFQFGGIGDYSGCFKSPTAVALVNGRFFVADGAKNSIGVFNLTSYGESLMQTAKLHKEGDYEAEELLWSEIFAKNNNSVIALSGLANVEYRNGDYKLAMEHFKLADDTVGYGKAYKEYRKDIMNQNAGLIAVIIAIVLILVIVLFKLYKKRITSPSYKPSRLEGSLEFGRKAVFRPLSHFYELTWEKRGTMSAAVIIFAVVELIMVLEAYCTGYIFAGKSEVLQNPLIVVLKVPFILALYTISSWCVTSLMDGKAKISQIFMANCYAMVPIIFLIPISVLISNFVTLEEGSFYYILTGLAYFWVIVLVICANKQINDYDFGRSIGVLLIIVLVMAVIVFLGILFFALIQQMYSFIVAIIRDIGGMF